MNWTAFTSGRGSAGRPFRFPASGLGCEAPSKRRVTYCSANLRLSKPGCQQKFYAPKQKTCLLSLPGFRERQPPKSSQARIGPGFRLQHIGTRARAIWMNRFLCSYEDSPSIRQSAAIYSPKTLDRGSRSTFWCSDAPKRPPLALPQFHSASTAPAKANGIAIIPIRRNSHAVICTFSRRNAISQRIVASDPVTDRFGPKSTPIKIA